MKLQRDLRREAALVERGASPGAVHRTRVAARRLRSLATVLVGLRDRPAAKRYVRDLRALAHELAPVREADVLRKELLDTARKVKTHAPSAQRHLAVILEQQRAAARKSLRRHTHSLVWSERLERLDRSAQELARELARAADGRLLARSMLLESAQALARARRHVDGSARALHRLRIQAKASRYVTEVLAKQLGLEVERLAAPARVTQQVVGRYLDARAARKWVARQRESLAEPLSSNLRKRLGRDEKRALKASRRELRVMGTFLISLRGK